MRVKSLIITILIFLANINLFAQNPIPLKEVNVYPPGYIKEILEKVNIALASNYETKKYFKYNLESEAKVNNNQIIEKLNKTTSLKTNPLVFNYYKSKGRIDPQIIDSTFYRLEHLEQRRYHKFLFSEIFMALGLDKKDFLTYNEKYEYSIKRIENIISIEFKSSYYCGKITLNPNNFNLISLDYYNDKSFSYWRKNLIDNDFTKVKVYSKSDNLISCSLKYILLKNNKFVLANMDYEIEYQDYTITNLVDKTIIPKVFKKINSKIKMSLN